MNVYLLNVIKVQRVTILSICGLYSTHKNLQNNDAYAPAATKKRHVAQKCLLQCKHIQLSAS